MKLCQITDNDPIIIVLCQNDFSETLSESISSWNLDTLWKFVIKINFTYYYVLSEGNETTPDHCYGTVIRTL